MTLGLLAKDCPQVPFDTIIEACEDLGTIDRKLHRIHERQCNGYQTWQGQWDEEAQTRDERAAERLRAKLAGVCKTLGVQAQVNGDPRGGAVRLLLPSGRSNTMDGETWSINWV